jgi:hypothetical protein
MDIMARAQGVVHYSKTFVLELALWSWKGRSLKRQVAANLDSVDIMWLYEDNSGR